MNSICDKLLHVFIAACFSGCIAIIGWLTYWAADLCFIQDQEGVAFIADKGYQSPWGQFIYHSDGKGGGWTQYIHHPESWSLTVKMGDVCGVFHVSESSHNKAVIGGRVHVRYGKGRFSGSTYITTAYFD